MTSSSVNAHTSSDQGERIGRRLSTTRLAVATGCGLGAGAVGVIVWFLVQFGTKSQMLYLVVAVGAGVGYAVAVGARRGGLVTAALSVVIAAVAIVVGLYYVDRQTFIRDKATAGIRLTVPLWPSWDWFWFVVRAGFRTWVSQYAYLGGGLIAAGWYGFRGSHHGKAT